MRYDLPQGHRTQRLSRTLFVWGLPILGWAVLVLLFVVFVAPADENKPLDAVADEAPATSQEVPAAVPSEIPDTPVSPAPVSGEQTAATPSQTLPVHTVLASAAYDFTGAASKIGLKKEELCATGILVDPATRKVLWAKAADKSVPIASMTKMMTMLLAEEDLAKGVISRDSVIQVTRAAYEIGGSQVWLDPRESFPLSELMKAIAIKSANDAAYLVAEYLGRGDISAFIARMNQRAKELNMKSTLFYEPHGLGDAQKRNNTASAHDMVLLAEALLHYPKAIELASTRMDTFRNGKTELKNHNNLVFQRVPGVDGLKTGYTKASGFCVTFTCLRNNRRLIGCVTGYASAKDRDAFCKALLDWGYTK